MQLSLSLPLLLILLCYCQSSLSTTIQEIDNNLIDFIHEVQRIVPIVRSDIEQLKLDTGEFNDVRKRENQIKVISHFQNISAQVENIEKHYVRMTKSMLYRYLGTDQDGYELNKIASVLLDASNDFERMKDMEKYEQLTLLSFCAAVASPYEGTIPNRLKNELYSILFGLQPEYIRKDLLTHLANMRKFSGIEGYLQQQSPQQHVYSMYTDIALSELKAYILVEYALMIRRVSGRDNLIDEWNTIRSNYMQSTEYGLSQLRNLTQQADRSLWRCDPVKHVLGDTYDEVTRLLQGYVENEVDLNNEGICTKTCPDYQNTSRMGCYDNKFCSQQPQCSGRIHNCQFVDFDLSVCQSAENSTRRYEFIQYGEGQRLGEYKNCWRGVNKVESWRRWIFWQCTYCFCLCDEQGPKSDRYFNLRAAYSDVKDNKVVTGVRFVKKNRIFHLQIQQGQLLPRGVINESTVDWVPVDDYKIYDSAVKNGVDFHTLSYQHRAIDLDDVMSDDRKFVVTGVRFQVLDGHLNLKVHLTKFNFVEGKLVEPKVNSVWQSNNNIYNRQKLNLDNLDVSTRSLDRSQVLSKGTQYLEFANTGLQKDAAQTTVPFIDIQDVVALQPVPLAGIGIYYKGSKGYGGYVAPKVISYDIFPHLPLIRK